MEPLAHSSSYVHALGDMAAHAAEIYAELTRRKVHHCKTLQELNAKDNDVVICHTDLLSAALMHHLYVQPRMSGVPGLLFGASPSELEDICRRHAARRTSGTTVNATRLFAYPKADFSVLEHGTDVFLGGRHDHTVLLDRLATRPALFVMVDRADGYPHLALSHGKYACPFIENATAPKNELLPICQVRERCTRLRSEPTMVNAAAEGSIIPMSKLSAGIAVIYMCGVVGIKNGIYDPAYSLAAGLLREGHFGAIVTTWRSEDDVADGAHLNTLLNEISSGVRVGLAVKNFNESKSAGQLGIRLCLLGDPHFTIEHDTKYPVLPPVRIRPEQHRLVKAEARHDAEARMLTDAVQGAMRVSNAYRIEHGKKLLQSLEAYKSGHDRSLSYGLDDEHLLEFLSKMPWLDRFLGRVGQKVTSSEFGRCHNCGELARIQWLQFPRYAATPRRIIHCACCGESSFLPSKWNVVLDPTHLNRGRILISGIPLGGHACFYLVDRERVRIVTEWTGLGTVPKELCLPKTLPEEPLSGVVMIASQLLLGAVSIPLRPLSNGAISSPAHISATTL